MLEHLGQVLPAGASKYGDKTALIFKGRQFSYNELNDLRAGSPMGCVPLASRPAIA